MSTPNNASTSNSQKLRRNGSPSTKQGPIRATKQFGLTSPTSRGQQKLSPSASPAPIPKSRNRPLSETCILGERRSPSCVSPLGGQKPVEKPKPVIVGRSSSFENLMAPYLSGQWPKDGQWQKESTSSQLLSAYNPTYNGAFTSDKQTQTPENWDELSDRRRAKNQVLPYKRSHSVGSGDHLKNIKHKLQRNGSNNTATQSHASPSINLQNTINSSQPIKIPFSSSTGSYTLAIPPRGTPGKARGSVEGLNQEVEKLIISGRCSEADYMRSEDADGHRAPIVELLTMSTDTGTQTPIEAPCSESIPSDPLPIMFEVSELNLDRSNSQNSEASQSLSNAEDGERSQSDSPSFIPGHFELEDSPILDANTSGAANSSQLTKRTTSPCPNSEFLREPPDGAEKVKLVDEISSAPADGKLLTPVSTVRFQPSATSAFHYLPILRRNETHTLSPIIVDDTH